MTETDPPKLNHLVTRLSSVICIVTVMLATQNGCWVARSLSTLQTYQGVKRADAELAQLKIENRASFMLAYIACVDGYKVDSRILDGVIQKVSLLPGKHQIVYRAEHSLNGGMGGSYRAWAFYKVEIDVEAGRTYLLSVNPTTPVAELSHGQADPTLLPAESLGVYRSEWPDAIYDGKPHISELTRSVPLGTDN